MAAIKQENITTIKIMMQKIYANDLHAKLGHPGEYRMHTTAKHLQYSVKGAIVVCEECATEKKQAETAI